MILPPTVNKNDGSKVTKQDCIISDSTGTCRLVLWETDVEKLVQGQSYQIKVASVRIFKDTKYLSISANCTFSEVANIGVVKEPSDDEDNAKFKDVVGEIDTVLSLEQYYSCKSCKSKLQQDGVFAKCPKCSSLAKISNCTMVSTARVIIGDIDGNDHIVSLFEADFDGYHQKLIWTHIIGETVILSENEVYNTQKKSRRISYKAGRLTNKGH